MLFQILSTTVDGTPRCAYFSVYRKSMDQSDAVIQFYLAHLSV